LNPKDYEIFAAQYPPPVRAATRTAPHSTPDGTIFDARERLNNPPRASKEAPHRGQTPPDTVSQRFANRRSFWKLQNRYNLTQGFYGDGFSGFAP
jgi:hypothetical protein